MNLDSTSEALDRQLHWCCTLELGLNVLWKRNVFKLLEQS